MAENTRDLSKFGYRELEMLRDLLTAMLENGLPDDFYDEGVTAEFNPNSGYVFLTNAAGDVAMLTSGGTLESWYFTPYDGHEGFLDDLLDEVDEDWDVGDLEYLVDICDNNDRNEDAERIRAMIEEA